MLRAAPLVHRPFACRLAHTRAKKVNVQMLKDGHNRRFRGEICSVSEGHMRLKLHPEGTAAYVLPNEPTPLPVLPAHEAQRMRRAAQQAAKLSATQADKEEREAAASASTGTEEERVQSLIDALSFPTFKASAQPAGAETTSQGGAPAGSPAGAPARAPAGAPAEEPQGSAKDKQFAWQNDIVVELTDRQKRAS